MFAHLTLATRDVPATREFFRRTLGWLPIVKPGNITLTADWLEIAPGQQLHLLQIPGFEPSAFEGEFGRHFAIFHPAHDFTALQQRLTENGATVHAALRPTPFARFFFRDPNGYFFEVIDRDSYHAET